MFLNKKKAAKEYKFHLLTAKKDLEQKSEMFGEFKKVYWKVQVTVVPVRDASGEQVDEVVLERDGEEGRPFLFGRNSRSGRLGVLFIVAWPTVVVRAEVLIQN